MSDDGPEDVARPSVAEVFARAREPVELTDDEILAAIHDGRR
jgi:hypothetical protein